MLVRILILTAALGILGCDLPPLPLFGPGADPDAGEPEDAHTGPVVCDPSSRRCIGNSVRVCSPDGTDFAIEACGVGDTCSAGACEPIASTCETDQPFALSATELAFDVSRDFKSQTKEVRLQNCGVGPIIIRDMVVRSPARPDGTPVFELATSLAQTSIPAGASVDIKVTYRPIQGLSHVTGRLELSLVLGELVNVEVALRSKALCVGATPYIDLGMRTVDQEVRAAGRLQNCGTEPVTVTGWEGPEDVDLQFGAPLPYELRAGGELEFETSAVPEAAVLLDANIQFAFDDPLQETTTKMRGIAAKPDCVETEFGEPQILVNNQLRPPVPGALVRIRFPDGDPLTYHWLDPLRQPQGSFARLERVSDGWTTRPRTVGRYRATLRGYDLASGARSCDLDQFVFEVYPSEDTLHIELTWVADGDGIPEDLGFGHSANLDLHVLSTSDGDGRWNHVETDCFPGVVGPCGEGGGAVSVSQGGLPEFVRFENLEGLHFEVGVYLSNLFNFDGVLARVRVYRGRELLAELTSESLRNANDFWLVGRWDEDAEQWTPIDRVFSGFPL